MCPALLHVMTDSRTDAIVRELLDYLEDHPDASDTAAGIARWWLATSLDNEVTTTVLPALECLVRARRIDKRILADGTVLFSKHR